MPKAGARDQFFFRVHVATDGLTLDACLTRDRPVQAASDGQNGATARRRRRIRGDRPRARTIAPKRFTKAEMRLGMLLPLMDYQAPQTRGECRDGRRPCPFVSCRYHLYLDVSPATGSIKLNFPHLEVRELRETCALDVADWGGATLERVADVMNLTRERIRQVEVRGLRKLKTAGASSRALTTGVDPQDQQRLSKGGEP